MVSGQFLGRSSVARLTVLGAQEIMSFHIEKILLISCSYYPEMCSVCLCGDRLPSLALWEENGYCTSLHKI